MGRPLLLVDRVPSWLVVQLLGTVGLLLALLVTPTDSGMGSWTIYGSVLACWLTFVLCGPAFPRFAQLALATGTLLAAVWVGFTGDLTTLVMCCIMLGRLAALDEPSAGQIVFAVTVPPAATAAIGLATSGSLVQAVGPLPILVVPILFGLNRRQYGVQIRQGQQLLEQSEKINEQQARAAALDERARIAREMHDVLAHSLGALSVQLEVAEALLSERNDPMQALSQVRRSRRLVKEGLSEARRAVAALRGDVPPLSDALAELVQAHKRDHHVTVGFHQHGRPLPLSTAGTVALLQAAREALTNAGRHAPGRRIDVTLGYGEGVVWVGLANELPAEPPVQRDNHVPGYGLAGMHERLALVGGTLTAGVREPEPGHGGSRHWLVTAQVPA
ncbi:sensor histidine kinase [Streptomyces sp. NPDC054841]